MIRSRVTGGLDTGRLAKALQRPGIDTRTWVSLASVKEIQVEADGAYADVELMPGLQPETARVAVPYAGPGFGDWNPIGVDDEVVIVFPDGMPDAGGVIIARLYSPSDPVPDEAVAHPDDRLIRVKSGQSLRIIVEEGGNLFLGSGDATDGEVKGTSFKNSFTSISPATTPPGDVLGVVNSILTALKATPLSTKVKVS